MVEGVTVKSRRHVGVKDGREGGGGGSYAVRVAGNPRAWGGGGRGGGRVGCDSGPARKEVRGGGGWGRGRGDKGMRARARVGKSRRGEGRRRMWRLGLGSRPYARGLGSK